jgi:ligand-binding SRPBCC domain-containing protein
MIYTISRQQQLNCDLGVAWNFFTSPHNLARITPTDMRFKVLSDVSDYAIYQGMIIDYKVAPLFGISVHWRTEITQVQERKSFTDVQLSGPYKLWRHVHEFIPNDLGVMVKDTVDYKLPWGILGRLVHGLIVKRKLNYIFNYRHDVLERMYQRKNIV